MEREPEFLEGTSGSSMTEAVVCASCPETYHNRIAELCLRHQVQKAFGKAVYIERTKWKRLGSRREAKVVMATVIKAQTLKSNKALILGIAGGKNGEVEMAEETWEDGPADRQSRVESHSPSPTGPCDP